MATPLVSTSSKEGFWTYWVAEHEPQVGVVTASGTVVVVVTLTTDVVTVVVVSSSVMVLVTLTVEVKVGAETVLVTVLMAAPRDRQEQALLTRDAGY